MIVVIVEYPRSTLNFEAVVVRYGTIVQNSISYGQYRTP